MDITSSYNVEIKKINKALKNTVCVYRRALSYLITVVNENWDELKYIRHKEEKQRFVEKLTHNTKNYKAQYDFDQQFYKYPSYLRRATISAAIGCVSSYRSNYDNWLENGEKGNPPKLQTNHYAMPTFFRDNMFIEKDNNEAELKLFVNGDWVWITVKLSPTDIKYIKKYWSHIKASAPTLERRHHKWFLRFVFKEKVKLSDAPIERQRVCAVDLGLNTDAVCSVMNVEGTVLARKFIDFPSDKDRLCHVLNRIKKFQRKNGSRNVRSFWAYAKRLNIEHSKKVASAMVSFAASYGCDCIVFEHLGDMRGKVKRSKKQRLRLWRKNGIQNTAAHKAHRRGIRIARVCPKNTSALAFDGSGELTRARDNHALATFSNGKQYNCDLSASYNIGARYFIRELLKPFPEREKSRLLANVPEVERRTSCTLHTLRETATFLATRRA